MTDRQRRAAAGVAVQLGEDDARDVEQVVEALRDVDRILPGHRIDDEQNLGRPHGGAALSVRHITGKPIKFVGVGEKLDDIEPFHPDRMASRILGMGDVLSLIEKAEQAFDEKKAAELERKFREQSFTLGDYLEQFRQIKSMGSVESLLGMMPGVKPGALKDAKIDEKQIGRTEAIILSMTERERVRPDIINSSRKKRIAAGSGTSVEEVNRLLKQYEQTKDLMKRFMGGRKKGKKGRMAFPF